MKQPYQALPVDVPPRTWDRGMANLAVGMLALAVLLELVLRLGRLTGGGPYTFVAIGGLFGALLLPIVAIQALRWLGRKNVDDQVIARLRRQLSPRDRKEALLATRHAPAWIAEHLRAIAREEGA